MSETLHFRYGSTLIYMGDLGHFLTSECMSSPWKIKQIILTLTTPQLFEDRIK